MLNLLLNKVGVLTIGTAAGHGLVLLSTPYLTSLYSAAEFGTLALIMTVCNIATAAACFRYDLAITTASKRYVTPLAFISVICLLFSAALAITLLWLGGVFLVKLKIDLSLVLMGVLAAGALQLTTSIILRSDKFINLGILRFIQGGGYVVIAVFHYIELVWAYLLALLVATTFSMRKFKLTKLNILNSFKVAKKFKKYPIILLPGALLDVLAYSAAIWIVSANYGLYEAGNLSQIQRVLGAPFILISMSLGQVLLRHCADNNSKTLHNELYAKCIRLFILVGVLFFVTLYFFGEWLLKLILTGDWIISLSTLLPLAIAIYVRAIASPLSALLLVMKRYDLILLWQVGYFLTSTIFLYYFASQSNFSNFIICYSLHEVFHYFLYLLYIKISIR